MMELKAQPIPGMSLAGEPGNAPWEQPPKLTTLDEVVKDYVEKLTTPKAVEGLLNAMKTDAPLMAIANTLVKSSMMKGIHSIDVGMIAIPIIIELMKVIGDMNGVGYVVEAEDYQEATEIDEATAIEVLKEAKAAVAADVDVKRGSGLMARGEM